MYRYNLRNRGTRTTAGSSKRKSAQAQQLEDEIESLEEEVQRMTATSSLPKEQLQTLLQDTTSTPASNQAREQTTLRTFHYPESYRPPSRLVVGRHGVDADAPPLPFEPEDDSIVRTSCSAPCNSPDSTFRVGSNTFLDPDNDSMPRAPLRHPTPRTRATGQHDGRAMTDCPQLMVLCLVCSLVGTEAGAWQPDKDNVVYSDTYQVEYQSRQRVLVRLNGSTQVYSPDGSLTRASYAANLSIPDVDLGAQPLKIEEIIFSRAHRSSWEKSGSYRNLNQLLGTLDRQRRVLKAMGIVLDREQTLADNVIESKEELLGNAYFAMLFGGHVASGFELGILCCNIVLTLVVTSMILWNLVTRCCLPRYKRYKEARMIAAVNVETGNDELEAVCSEGSNEEADGENTDQVNQDDLSMPTSTSAPPPYNPIYPQLPTEENPVVRLLNAYRAYYQGNQPQQ